MSDSIYDLCVFYATKEGANQFTPFAWSVVAHGTKFTLGNTTMTVFKNGTIQVQGGTDAHAFQKRLQSQTYNELQAYKENHTDVPQDVATRLTHLEMIVSRLGEDVERLKNKE